MNNLQMSQDTLDQFRAATLGDAAQPWALNKATTTGIQQSTGLVWYDLQAPAKNLFPVITPIRNKIPRRSGNGGTATNWKAVTAINAGSLQPFVPEGVRQGVVQTTEVDYAASYKGLGLEDFVTMEANYAAKNLEDIRATTAQRLLYASMIQEELAFLGANNSVALGTPTAPTTATAASGGTVAAATYNVIAVALTHQGYGASSVANGVATLVNVTPADGGSTFAVKQGSSQKSTATAQITSGSTSTLSASTPVVPGAVAYAWYVGVSGSELLQAITTRNSVMLTALITGTQNASAITADNSQNTLAYDGLLSQAWKSGSGALITALATGVPGTGTTLTSDGSGGITEINTVLQNRWDNYRVSPTAIYLNSQEMNSIKKLSMANGSAPLVRFAGDFGQAAQGMVAGSAVGSYLNPFTMSGGQVIPLMLHPNVPAGTMLFFTDTLPYPITNIPNVAEYIYRQDWYQMEWPQRTRRYETGVYTDGVLAHYFPPSMAILNNIAPA